MAPSIWQLLIVLAIVVMLFGTKRLRGMGSDLGEAIRGFKKSVTDDDKKSDTLDTDADSDPKKVSASAPDNAPSSTDKNNSETH
jgi:sec-independent protein translocase protein TatA